MVGAPETVTLAMHIPDNFISPSTGAVFYVIMIPIWVLCFRYVVQHSTPEKMAYLGAGAAFSFLIMMFNVPTPGGTTAHRGRVRRPAAAGAAVRRRRPGHPGRELLQHGVRTAVHGLRAVCAAAQGAARRLEGACGRVRIRLHWHLARRALRGA